MGISAIIDLTIWFILSYVKLTQKRCTLCGETKPLDLFKKSKRYLFGRSSWCKSCQSKSVSEYQKTPIGKANKNRNNAKYKKTTKGKLATQRYKNGAAGKAASQRYWRGEAGRANSARGHNNHRKRSINLVNDLTAVEWEEILEKQNYRCKICDVNFDNSNIITRAERDHIIPLMYGGALTKSNVQALCRSCNASKSASIKIPQINTQTHFELIK